MLQRLKLLLAITDSLQDDVLLTYLDIAKQKLLDRLYPFDIIQELPERYALKQVEVSVYLYNRRGDEGQTAHSENGINRSYESADVPESMLRGVIPMVGIL